MSRTTLGERVAEARRMAGMTQAEWAREIAGSSRPATASDWETGSSTPDVATLQKMVALSGIDGHYLLTGEGSRTRTRDERDTEAMAEGFDRVHAVVLDVVGTMTPASTEELRRRTMEHRDALAARIAEHLKGLDTQSG